ncbi:Exodeoxyribonuclease III [Halothece sp. PCC 7418]|uniref:exodeoxyribonuclease III n=1 Tax=Halothece sp. (strain PCC 7418) TaxID=65093 RepID=UPI0002A08AB9|nr:exodeoxyribonuclease III [Halothece sp. PCC 7418]AFZ45557.1 Exodeoxyribonuclease III [Halothece sp. PCC 7418]
MKIATWNVNSIRTRKDQVLNWLKEHEVDVLCLQETKVIDDDFPRKPFEELGYSVCVSGQKAYNGVAIFSQQPLDNISAGFSPVVGEDIAGTYDEQKRVISGVIDGIRIVNLYIPNGGSIGSEKYEYKLGWFEVLKQYLQQLMIKSEICVCGDFNVAPEDRDIYDPKGKENHIMSSPPERKALETIKSLGFYDAFRKFNEETGYYSWWDYRTRGFSRNRGWRIDHHFLTEKLYEKATHCWIDIVPRGLEKPSDHTPVILEI